MVPLSGMNTVIVGPEGEPHVECLVATRVGAHVLWFRFHLPRSHAVIREFFAGYWTANPWHPRAQVNTPPETAPAGQYMRGKNPVACRVEGEQWGRDYNSSVDDGVNQPTIVLRDVSVALVAASP